MFPIGDDNTERTTQPIVNYVFIGLNVLVFLLLQQLGSNEAFDNAFALVPREITSGIDITGPQIVRVGEQTAQIIHYATPLPVYFNFLSSMFMHGDIMHIFGNMLFLFIFGDNLENRLGHLRYAVFYLLCGLGAAAGQIVMSPDSIIPMLGASGAISGILGGYVLLFPRNQVRAIILRFYTTVPAFVAIGIWIIYQLVLGYLTPSGGGGVAYAAHIGGFITGIALIKLFTIGRDPTGSGS
jgi:membrane associated rhomboid family serine protease